ncbi:MAG: hypothetical protein QXW32_04730 [Nitrososphaerales archaeon]
MVDPNIIHKIQVSSSDSTSDAHIVDASNLSTQELNQTIFEMVKNGIKRLKVLNVNGQRYIGSNLACLECKDVEVTLVGYVGNCLANLNSGVSFIIYGNCGDDLADTMQSGKVVVHGEARDVVAQALQGGVVYVKGNVGNRAGIQMREYLQKRPYLVIGGSADDYLGEYMAGGVIIVLGLGKVDRGKVVGNYVGSGMVGGRIYIRGFVEASKIGVQPPKTDIETYLASLVEEGLLDGALYVSMKDLSYYTLKAKLPDEIFEHIRRYYLSTHVEPPVCEYRELNTYEAKEIEPVLGDYISSLNLPQKLVQEVLSSKFTILSH